MNDQRLRPNATVTVRPSEAIPEAQCRALERRHALDQQQRSFRKPTAAPQGGRHRPPS